MFSSLQEASHRLSLSLYIYIFPGQTNGSKRMVCLF